MRRFFVFIFIFLGPLALVFGQTDPTRILDRILHNPEYANESEVIRKMRYENEEDDKILKFLEKNFAEPRRKTTKELLKEGVPVSVQAGSSKNSYPSVSTSCNVNDIGVELGNFGSWQGQTSTWNTSGGCTLLPWTPVPLPQAGRITLVPTPTADPCADASGFPILLPSPSGGAYSVKLGNNLTGAESERIIHQFTVQPQDVNFIYHYAMVFDEPGHLPSESPFFEIIILDQTGDTIPCSFKRFTAVSGIPGFQASSNPVGCGGMSPTVTYKPWTLGGVDLSNYIGQSVTLICTTGDCALCGHMGYAYVDFSCGGTPLSAGCAGSPTNLCAPGDPGTTYLWSTGGTTACINVTPNPGDTYSVSVNSPSGCNFNAQFAAGNSNVQALFTYSLSVNTVNFTNLSTGSTVYNWNFGDGSFSSQQDPVHTYAAPGTYSACLTAGIPGCSSISCKSITITTVGLDELDLFSSVSVFPNPASDELTIDFQGTNFVDAEISLSNVVGKKIFYTKTQARGKQIFNISKFPEGIYFIRIDTNAGSVTKKIVLSR